MQIDEHIDKEITTTGQSLHSYSFLCGAQTGHYAAENGSIAAVQKYGKFGMKRAVPGSTLWSLKKKYLKNLEETKTPLAELPHAFRDRL